MARINIEDCWWTDPRRSLLIRKLNSEEAADGTVIKAWRLAQEFWKTGQSLIPFEIFETLPNFQAVIDSKLADVRGAFVYVRGSSAYLDWVREKREQAKIAGKKSAEIRKQKTGSAQPKPKKPSQNLNKPERTPNDPRTEFNDAEPSDSGSYSVSGSSSDSNSGSAEFSYDEVETSPPAKSNSFANKQTWETYREAYISRYNVEPLRNAKTNSQVSQFVKRVGEGNAPSIAKFYLKHSDPFYVRNSHAFGFCLRDAESLSTQWLRGQTVTFKDAQNQSAGDEMKNQIARLTKGVS